MVNKTQFRSAVDTSENISDYCLRFFDAVVFDNDVNSIPHVINCILNIPTSIAAIFGNLLVLLSIWNTPLHSPSHVLLFGLAMADFGVGLLVQPAFIVLLFAKIHNRLQLICTSGIVATITANFLCTVSLLTLTAISLDRFLALHLLLRYKGVVTTKRVICLLVGIWFYSTLSAISILVQNFGIGLYLSGIISCVCICLMLFSYVSIFHAVRRQQTQIQSQQSHRHEPNSLNMLQFKKLCFAMFLICCLFLLCYLPFVSVTVWIAKAGYSSSAIIAFEFSSTVVFLGSCLNPVVYCWRLLEMREAFLCTLRKCCSLHGTSS